MTRTLIVSSSDTNYFPLLQDMLRSLAPQLDDARTRSIAPEFAFLDVGLAAEDIRWLSAYSDRIVAPRPHFGIDGSAHKPSQLAFLVRPFLPEYFPGYDVYLWIDSDVWLQSPDCVVQMVQGAARTGMAIAHERERAYRFQAWLFAWTAKHFLLGYGALRGAWLLARPHLNAGIFAIAGNAPHWDAWARRYRDAIARTGNLTPHDQFALNQAIHQDRLETAIVAPNANWICARGQPMWSDEAEAFCEPYPPYRVISAMHLAGPAKTTSYRIRRTGGDTFDALLRYGARPPCELAVAVS